MELNKIYHEDCIIGMKKMNDNSVDLIIADPPYNLSKGNNWKWDNSVKLEGMGGNWNKAMEDWDNMSLEDYFNFTDAWIKECKRILKPSGSMWIFGTYHNIGIVNILLQKNNVEIINEIVWYKRNSFPNLSRRRLTASHETILWGHSGEDKREYYFDYVFSKDAEFPEDNLKKYGKQMRTVWDIPNNKKKRELEFGKHPTQKPLRVINRIINLSTKPGDTVLMPFSGSGTECLSAKELGRNYIGFEIDKDYIELSEQRLKNAQTVEDETLQLDLLSDEKQAYSKRKITAVKQRNRPCLD